MVIANATTITATSHRKRCRNLVGMSLALAALCVDSSSAFTNPPAASIARRALPSRSIPAQSTSLNMVSSSVLRQVMDDDVSNNNNKTYRGRDALASAPPRLSAEEQKDLLLQAVELRRLRNVEKELAMRTNNATPLVSIRSKEAGYGDDIVAYEDAIFNGEEAREQLITTNMGLVHYCVNEIIGSKKQGKGRRLNSLSREDLVQEGAIGLARAIDRWNPAIGGKFSTYAVYWVRAAILRCIAEKDDILRVPEHVSTAVRKMTRGAKKLGIDVDGDSLLSNAYAHDASWKEAQAAKALAEEAGLTDKQLTEALRIRSRRNAGGYVAYESWMQKGKDIESDISSLASREPSPLRSVAVEDLKKTLGRYLRPKEMEALFLRYGLLDEEEVAATAESTAVQSKPKQPKNYLAIAEEELYGKSKATKSKKKSTKAKKSTSKATKAAEIPVRGKWGEAMSFTEVGKRMEVSAEYGRRLTHAALKKLRQAADDGLLEPALLF